MILATRNRLYNCKNHSQTGVKRVLCVCSAGALRSPTLSNYIHKEYGYNTRSCGTSKEYAIIPLDECLITWADCIVFVNKENYLQLDAEELALISELGTVVKILNIEDIYNWNDEGLIEEIKSELNRIKFK